ncbi:hypothetical protein L1987_42614 [Smallanthus sonchifolius]|uniref:Uncharacterized protein n=1 Tax=Smallanthus sonchifolius TaxID=185202 RepID=A0ACB9GKH3_9ASTR|nr:hypothetical protein L1987_42614 [Smallanthus sonchifolius]
MHDSYAMHISHNSTANSTQRDKMLSYELYVRYGSRRRNTFAVASIQSRRLSAIYASESLLQRGIATVSYLGMRNDGLKRW